MTLLKGYYLRTTEDESGPPALVVILRLLDTFTTVSSLNDGMKKETVLIGAAGEVILFPWQLNRFDLFARLIVKCII